MEAAGLVIGIVPLAIELFKTWKLVYETTVQFGNAMIIIESLFCRINTQRLLFRGELKGLVNAVGVGTEVAEKMLADSKHPEWKSASTKIAGYLGTVDEEHFVRHARLIMRQLEVLKGRLGDLNDVYSPRRRVCSLQSI
jgi:hypothetical protein